MLLDGAESCMPVLQFSVKGRCSAIFCRPSHLAQRGLAAEGGADAMGTETICRHWLPDIHAKEGEGQQLYGVDLLTVYFSKAKAASLAA